MLSQFKKTKFASGPYLWKDILLIDAEWRTSSSVNQVTIYDDVIKWKHFPRYWPLVRGIHLSRPVTPSFDVFFDPRPRSHCGHYGVDVMLAQITGRRLFGAISLSEAMLIPKKLCKWYKFEIQKLYSRHYIWKCCVQIGGHFVWIVMCWYQMIFADRSTYDLKKTDLFNSYCVIKNEMMYDGNGRKAHTNRMSGHTVRYDIIH